MRAGKRHDPKVQLALLLSLLALLVAAFALGGRDAERLRARVSELEQRVAELEAAERAQHEQVQLRR